MKLGRALQLTFCPIAVVLGGCVGAGSFPLPPALMPSQVQRMRELPLPYSVGVVRDKIPVYSDHLTKVLISSRAFKRVAPLASFSRPPDLIATVEERIYGSSAIPLWPLLTGGVLPSTTQEDYGVIFSLAPASNRHRKTIVDAHYRGTSTLGWIGLAIAASPNQTRGDPEETKRFRDMLAYRSLVALRPFPASKAIP